MRRPARALRILSWVVLVAGAAGAILLWVTAREAVETTRTIYGHGTLRFQDVDIHLSVTKIALGAASLILGAFLWAVGRAVAGMAEAVPRRPDDDSPGG
jgi:predicted SpoU family rRNA methylase